MSAGVFWMMSVGIVAAMAGFWTGRLTLLGSIAEGQSEGDYEGGREVPKSRELKSKKPAGGTSENRKMRKKPADKGSFGRKQHGNERRIPLGWAIGSPAEGRVSTYSEGNRRGAMVQGLQSLSSKGVSSMGLLYAPASGKITKLYPLGNQMILRTDFGVELLIRVGDNTDEFLGEYFRPRILQNEFVNKGKLLLEYDREGILSEGGNADISVSVTAAEDFDNITVTDREQVKTGEEILWVRDRAGVV